jgi:hypothetical protein
MNSIRISMRYGEQIISLKDILAALPDNEWTWALVFFYGIGTAPANLTMLQFEEKVRKSTLGVRFSWQEIKRFAEGLDETYDCLLAAIPAPESFLDAQAIRNENYGGTKLVIEGFDSSYWNVVLNDDISVDDLTALAVRS